MLIENGYEGDKKLFAEVAGKIIKTNYVRKLGTSALELSYVARGLADGFINCGDQLWDISPGILLVREAGGRVTNWKGDEWHIGENFVLASNEALHSALLSELSEFHN